MAMSAQEPTDTTKVRELDAVTVEAATQYAKATSSTYIPVNKLKKASTNAIDLLARMQIPEITVDPLTGTVKDLAGQGVAIFIDGRKASNEEIQGMRMADVLRVEYLSHPSDSRFMHETSVINFIMRKYEYGGYTKLYETLNWLPYTTWNVENLFAYSRMAFKKSIWNIWGGAYTWNSSHYSPEIDATFRFGGYPEMTINRLQHPIKDRKNDLGVYGGIEHIFNSSNIQIAQAVDLTYSHVPLQTTTGNIDFVPEVFGIAKSGQYSQKSPSRTLMPRYTGRYYFVLGKGWSVNTGAQFTYSHDKKWSFYEASDQVSINNNVFSDRYELALTQDWSKNIDTHNSVSLLASGRFVWEDFHYTGNNPLDLTQNDKNVIVSGFYQLQLQKLYLSITGGASFFWNRSGSISQKDVAPDVSLFARYSFDRKNSIQLNTGYRLQNRAFSLMSDHLVQENELLYSIGNPELKRDKRLFVRLQYLWMPSNSLSGVLYVNCESSFNKPVAVYSIMEDRLALLANYINSGNSNRVYAGLNLTWRLLNGNLAMQVHPTMSYESCTGVYDARRTGFQVKTSVYYYLGNFNFCALYESPMRHLHDNGMKMDYSDVYDLQAGWGNGTWNLWLSFRNPLRRSWKEATFTFDSPLYSYFKTSHSAFPHSRISLQVCYTIGYGKKIQQGNERGPRSVS